MIIDTRKYTLQYKDKTIDLEKREQKLILLLSDNEWHKRNEVRNYLGFITNLYINKFIKKLNQKIKNTAKINLVYRKKDNYKIYGNVLITY